MSGSPTRGLLLGALLLCLLRWPSHAIAHDLSFSVLRVRELSPGEFLTSWEQVQGVRDREAAYLLLRPLFPEHCTFAPPRLHCSGAGLSGRLGFAGLGELSASGALIRVEWREAKSQSFTFGAQTPQTLIRPPARQQPASTLAQIAKTFTLLGVEHILFGWDHLLFVLALMWVVTTRIMLLKTISAFTVAHSLTLGMAALRVFQLPVSAVEAVIALSIVLVTLEALRSRRDNIASLTARAPWLVALGFGLLHGFGFASALSSIDVERAQLPISLLFFNVGVELGQLAFVALVSLVSSFARRLPTAHVARGTLLVQHATGGVAMYWFLQRVLSL